MKREAAKPNPSHAIYRICAVDDEHWDVLQEASPAPLASFTNKHAALAYAMRLARQRPGGPSPIERRAEAIRALFGPRGPQA
ncbi:MAG TPA: hypothetical protein VIY54_14125 [Steroidobacteraceae bacterium]